MMDWLTNIDWQAGFGDGRFFWIEWHFWKVIGWTGNVVFFSRFIVQWIATEKRKRVVVPSAFWWLSLVGTLLLLSYALFYQHDSVFIAAYAFNWIPYIRNLIIHRRHKQGAHGMSRRAKSCVRRNPTSALRAGRGWKTKRRRRLERIISSAPREERPARPQSWLWGCRIWSAPVRSRDGCGQTRPGGLRNH